MSEEVKPGDVFVKRRNSGRLVGHYWGEMTVQTVAGNFASVRGKLSYGGGIKTVQVMVPDLIAWGRKKP